MITLRPLLRYLPLSGRRLSLEVDQVLEDLVGRRDHLRVGLEAALGHDHVRELLRQIDQDGYEVIVAALPDTAGLGLAVDDRLRRAAASYRQKR